MHPSKLPIELLSQVDVDSLSEDESGKSESRVFKVKLKSGGSAHLKMTTSAEVESEILQEVKVLAWLQGQAHVPRPIFHGRNNGAFFFLMTSIPGTNLAEIGPKLGIAKCLQAGAKYMKELHSIPTKTCPFDRRARVAMKFAQENVLAGLVDEGDFDTQNLGKSANEVYELLVRKTPDSEDLVFTHGDFSFPNLIYSGEVISGAVDFSRAGIADRHQDIALFLRSFKTTLGPSEIETFLSAYGLVPELSFEKIQFYQTLDEFF